MVQAARRGTLLCLYLHRNNQAATFLKLSEEGECPLREEKMKNKLQNPGLDKEYTKVSKCLFWWVFFFFFSRGAKY